MTRFPRILLVFALLALSWQTAEAQRSHRSGFWLEFGTGPGASRVSCTSCSEVTTQAGSGGFIRFGMAVADNVLLGIESFGLTDDQFGFSDDPTPAKASMSTLGAVVIWYPWRAGLLLTGSVGIAGGDFTVTPPGGPTTVANGVGTGLGFGVGYDLKITGGLALSANLSAHVVALGDIVLPTSTVDDVIATVYAGTLGLTIK